MDAKLAALPPSARLWAELLLESVHWCAAELPGRGTWPQRVVWAIVVLSLIDSWFHALFCMRYILYDPWLCYALRDIKLYLQQRMKTALSCIVFFLTFISPSRAEMLIVLASEKSAIIKNINLPFSPIQFKAHQEHSSALGVPKDLGNVTCSENQNICIWGCDVDRKCAFLLHAQERNLIRFT